MTLNGQNMVVLELNLLNVISMYLVLYLFRHDSFFLESQAINKYSECAFGLAAPAYSRKERRLRKQRKSQKKAPLNAEPSRNFFAGVSGKHRFYFYLKFYFLVEQTSIVLLSLIATTLSLSLVVVTVEQRKGIATTTMGSSNGEGWELTKMVGKRQEKREGSTATTTRQ